jgi:nucleoside-diphosphate-sugar epimerase
LTLNLCKFLGPKNLIADLTDSGQTFNARSTHFDFDGFELGHVADKPDAVVHFAAIPRVVLEPDNKTFSANVLSTNNAIEAAMKLGVWKVIIASSETTYGVCFAEGDKGYHHFLLEEDNDVDPMDSYGLSKVVNEKTARALAAGFAADIYALRIANVIAPHDYERFPAFMAKPLAQNRNAWGTIDV